MKSLQVAVLGAGRIGSYHVELLERQVEGVQVRGVYDLDRSRAQAVVEKFELPRLYTSVEDALDDGEVDVVLIASSTDQHAPQIKQAAAAGKHIFCEKPIDLQLDAIDDALAAVKKRGVHLHVGFNRRFDRNFAEMKRLLETGAIGAPHVLRITSRDPSPPPAEYVKASGGIFKDMMIHDLDMARFLLGPEVESVTAFGSVMIDPAIGEAGDVDTAIAILRYRSGAQAIIENSRQAPYGYDQRIEVHGEKGVLNADNMRDHTVTLGDDKGYHNPALPRFFVERYHQAYVNQFRMFVETLSRSGQPMPVTGEDGRAAVLLAEACARSLKEGRTVRLEEMV